MKNLFMKYGLWCMALLIFSGCASGGGNRVLFPADLKAPGYSGKGRAWVFEHDSVKVAVSHVAPDDGEASLPLLDGLVKAGYLLLKMEMENGSREKVTYNPSLTSLVSGADDYSKPLDYTDFYELARESPDKEKALRAVRDAFYDVHVTLKPGERISRLLVFPPLSKNAGEATLSIKEMYIGTAPAELTFPFVFKDLPKTAE